MSPEETLRRYLDVQDSGSLYHFWSTGEMADEIASIIRKAQASARNEALEEAADSATKFLVGDPFSGVPLRSPGPHEVAAHILTLKTKD